MGIQTVIPGEKDVRSDNNLVETIVLALCIFCVETSVLWYIGLLSFTTIQEISFYNAELISNLFQDIHH